VSIATISINYPVTDLILDIKSHIDEKDTLIICFWDFDNFNIETIGTKNSRVLVNQISKLTNGLNIKNHIIFMSDAISRINRDENLSRALTSIKFNINFIKIQEIYEKHKYLDLQRATLGKVNFIATDYFISVFFKDIYPELAKGNQIDYIHSSDRILAIKAEADEKISKFMSPVKIPKIIFWKKIPILNFISREWISVDMSKKEIELEIRRNWPIDEKVIKDLIGIVLKLKNSILESRVQAFYEEMEEMNDERKIQEIVEIFYSYFFHIKQLIVSSEEENIKKITYIENRNQLKNILKTLNPAKLEILKACDGSKNIEEIIQKVLMNSNSVRSYISRMKKEGLITNSKKPLRLVDEIIINLE
jgi:predicted transcriptional regulator/predicted transposase YbfD/YdcC